MVCGVVGCDAQVVQDDDDDDDGCGCGSGRGRHRSVGFTHSHTSVVISPPLIPPAACVLQSVTDAIYTVKNILILDDEGKRIAARYYTSEFPTLEDQRAFELRLFEKTRRNRCKTFFLFPTSFPSPPLSSEVCCISCCSPVPSIFLPSLIMPPCGVAEIVMLDNSVVVYRVKMDCFLYVSGRYGTTGLFVCDLTCVCVCVCVCVCACFVRLLGRWWVLVSLYVSH
jgi:hypothetical protein